MRSKGIDFSFSAASTATHGCEAGSTYSLILLISVRPFRSRRGEHIVSRFMLLAVDVGNPQTHFGTFCEGELREHWRFATVRQSTSDQLGAALRNLLELRHVSMAEIDASIVSSTVPVLGPEWCAMAERYLGHETLVVGPGVKTAMPIRYDNPREIGPDRLRHPRPAPRRLR